MGELCINRWLVNMFAGLIGAESIFGETVGLMSLHDGCSWLKIGKGTAIRGREQAQAEGFWWVA